MRVPDKKYVDNLSRFRNDVLQFTGVTKSKKKGFKAPMTRKEKRKLEKKFKQAKKEAFAKKEKAPTLDALKISSQKKNKKKSEDTEKETIAKEPKNKPEKKTKNKSDDTKVLPVASKIQQLTAKDLVESRVIKEKKKEKNLEKSVQCTKKKKLLEDNQQEDKEIRKLEKLLKIKNKSKLSQNFYDDGLGDLLDFCDENKRDAIAQEEANAWTEKAPELLTANDFLLSKRAQKVKEANKRLSEETDDENQSMGDDGAENMDEEDFDEDMENGDDEMDNESFGDDDMSELGDKKGAKRRKVESGSDSDEENEDESEENSFEEDEDEDENGEDDDDEDDEEDDEERFISKEEEEEDKKRVRELAKKGIKEDIYGRLVNKKGAIVQSEKYVPPAQRLQQLLEKSEPESNLKLARLNKQLNGLFNRLSTANIHSISNQIIQMFYSNQFTRHELIETIHSLLTNSLIIANNISPIRLIVEHAALTVILSANIGIELGANILQKFCMKINENLSIDEFVNVDNKALDNLILLICNFYNFKLISSNLILDLLDQKLVEMIVYDEKSSHDQLEKLIDLILLIFRCVGFSLRKDSPIVLKDLIIKLHSKINNIKAKIDSSESSHSDLSINNRLKFMIESLTAIKNNDIRRLDAFDQQPIEAIKKQAKVLFKEEKDHASQLNISFKDLINANERGRWWIVGSAWNLKENETDTFTTEQVRSVNSSLGNGEGFSEKLLKLAKKQHMNTDIRRTIFCIILSAEDYTDAFMKLNKLSLKKQQEREIIYVIMQCVLKEKKYNPYYSFLMQKFCEYDRRFKITVQFHTWDKFKLLTEMSKEQVSNFASLISHLVITDCMSLSILKNAEFGEMNKAMLQFLREFLGGLVIKQSEERLQEIFLKVSTTKNLNSLRNALKLFISHFMLTDKGKNIAIEDNLKNRCLLVQKYLSITPDD